MSWIDFILGSFKRLEEGWCMPCPNIEFCPAKVDYKHYMEVCLSEEEWKNCKYYVDYKMTPAQWKKYAGSSTQNKDSFGSSLF